MSGEVWRQPAYVQICSLHAAALTVYATAVFVAALHFYSMEAVRDTVSANSCFCDCCAQANAVKVQKRLLNKPGSGVQEGPCHRLEEVFGYSEHK